MCEEFGCLPSELDGEDYGEIRRIHQARVVWRVMKRYADDMKKFLDSASEEEIKVMRDVYALRNKQ